MNEGYLVVRCSRCNSISQLPISGIRDDFSLCPMCLEGKIEFQEIQPSINASRKLTDRIHTLELHITGPNQFETN